MNRICGLVITSSMVFCASPTRAEEPATHAASEIVTLANVAPVVTRSLPVSGASDVDPSLTEIRVTYSKPMRDGSWSWSSLTKDSFPEITGKPSYDQDKSTAVLPVKLLPGVTYAIWLNSEKFHNFKDDSGIPAIPYLLVFKTRE